MGKSESARPSPEDSSGKKQATKSSSKPPRAKSVTKSSKSSTSDRATGLDTPVQFVKGVGPRISQVFSTRDIRTVKDLLLFLPRAYEDRTQLARIADLTEGMRTTVSVRVLSVRQIPLRSRPGKSMLEVRATDDSGSISFRWFNAPRGMESRFKPGTQFFATGAVKIFRGMVEMVHPELSMGVATEVTDSTDLGRIVPVYTEIEGLPTRLLRKVLHEACEKYSPLIPEDLPTSILKRYGFPKSSLAIKEIHFPTSQLEEVVKFKTPAHQRLIYEEFFKFELLVLRQKLKMEKDAADCYGSTDGQKALADLEKSLPFPLTGDQKKALNEITQDLQSGHPMNRLIQGDVGSGKTVVALLAAGIVISEGGQAALMAPTEILAEQHFRVAEAFFGKKLKIELLTGKSTASERKPILKKLADGEPLLLIGTHALIEEPVQFKNLGLVLIDEQHRFGVDQRRILRTKGKKTLSDGRMSLPHGLMLTATPIPRTLALSVYGDLSVTLIREKPPGRTPVITRVIRGAGERQATLSKIREELKSGRQAYFIFPLIEESEAEGFTELKSATVEAERLQREDFQEFKVGLLHGQMTSDEKNEVMEKFKSHELDILVSTTVIEVGVDVPNSTIMCIEHAERFGLSQLHQLRGRVGRGSHQSHCFLLTSSSSDKTEARLDILERSSDGFEIAEADLEIRGPGEYLGTRQAGDLPFHIAHLVRDKETLMKARDDAEALLREDPEFKLPDSAPVLRYLEREGKLQSDRIQHG